MEYRQLGGSGLKVPALSLGTGTFGGRGNFFGAWGNSDVEEASRLIDMCLEVGLNLIDTADVYSRGVSEEIVGKAIAGRRDKVLISTKSTFRMADGPNELGSSRHHILSALDASLKRLNTDYVDIYTMHGFDATTPVEETLRTLDTLVQSGKVRYLVCSNFSGWHLMKSLATADRYGWTRYVGHQASYSLIGREFEWELMPLGLDQKVSTLVWGPLGGGRLGGKFRRGQPTPTDTRFAMGGGEGPDVPQERLFDIVDALAEIGQELGKTIPQVALRWVMQRPTVATVIFGARNEDQLRGNLDVLNWTLSADQMDKLDRVSEVPPTYPYWHQRGFQDRNPTPVKMYWNS